MTMILLVSVQLSAQTITDEIDKVLASIVENRDKGQLDSADALAFDLKKRATSSNNVRLLAKSLFQLAVNSMARNDYPVAQGYLEDSIEYAIDAGDEQQLAHNYRQLGLSYRYQANYSLALENLYASLAIFQSYSEALNIGSVHNSIGVVLEQMGQLTEASEHHQAALEIHYKADNQQGIASAIYNIADIRREMGDLDIALDYFKQALAIDMSGESKKDIAYSHNKIGYVQTELGAFDEAQNHIEIALDLFTEIGAKRDIQWARSGLAALAFRRGKYSDAEELINSVISQCIEQSYQSLLVDSYIIATKNAMAQDAFSPALAFVEKGIVQAEKNNEMTELSELLLLKVDISENLQDLSIAYEALKREKELQFELINRQRVNTLANLQAQTEFIRRANQIEILEKEQALQNVQLQNEKANMRFIIVCLLASGLFGFFLYSRMLQAKHTKRLENEVDIRTQDLKKAYVKLEQLSLTDKLTGLWNRRFFDEKIEHDLQNATRQYHQAFITNSDAPKNTDICVFMIDIDHFKQINDTYGHSRGDRVLAETAKRLTHIFRESDYVVRWGGEEFVALARFIDRSEAGLIAERIRHEMKSTPFHLSDTETKHISCSIGFASFPACQSTELTLNTKALLDTADSCLYAAKRNGRDTWVGISEIFDTSILPILSDVNTLQELDAAKKLKLVVPSHQD